MTNEREVSVTREIPKAQVYPWLLRKHYARRIPPVMFAFGYYVSDRLEGVCTFGPPAKLMNDGACIFNGDFRVNTYELNRLVMNDGVPPYSLSRFVAQTLRLIKTPACIVSYSDIGQGHHGYIYQATNWVYTGITDQTGGFTYWIDGEWQHPRTTVSLFGTREHAEILKRYPDVEYQKVSRKHRYMMFLGDKRQRRQMQGLLRYPVQAYPKGDNERYDDAVTIPVQAVMV